MYIHSQIKQSITSRLIVSFFKPFNEIKIMEKILKEHIDFLYLSSRSKIGSETLYKHQLHFLEIKYREISDEEKQAETISKIWIAPAKCVDLGQSVFHSLH